MSTLKKYKPTSPGIRGTVLPNYRKLLSQGNSPLKRLTRKIHSNQGRSQGRISMRHHGGGHKRLFRDIDFLFLKQNVPGKVVSIEYDPNRTSFISLISYKDGDKKYILTPMGVSVGDTLITADQTPLTPGNRAKIKNIPVGSLVYNVALKVGGPAVIARSAGNSATILGHDGNFAQIKLPSGEVRKVPVEVFASIGSSSNDQHHLRVDGKAGRSRWKGIRPTVRGTAMNPVDHPHGGGEGRAGRGLRRAKTAWGRPSGKGQKTRAPKRYSGVHIVQRRKRSIINEG
ncbi:MAG: 50S ribosomal protein L2 [Alphaproteobacteria bacterium]|nr:50S ribosomal protein L2 [Alphaproteobacteria bacterium]